jgi:nucleoside-diphosphate-sugar epimerase
MSERAIRQVLVSGAAGWLGRRLVDVILHGSDQCDHLAEPEGAQVRCLVQNADQVQQLRDLPSRVAISVGDLRSPADCARFVDGARGAVLFHTAGVVHPRSVREFYDVNVEGTRNLLSAAVASRVRRAVLVSSSSVCGRNPSRDHRFDETSPRNPYMNYGRSKELVETLASQFHSQGVLETVVIRPPWFYGPCQPPRQTLFFNLIREGKCPIVGDGTNMRSMVYIDNLCQALIRAAVVDRAGGRTYWVADETAYSMNEIIDTVETVLESDFEIKCRRKRIRLPSLAGKAAEWADGLLQALGWYLPKIHVLSEMGSNIACTIDRAREELGYRPGVALREGMRRSIRWCLENGTLA